MNKLFLLTLSILMLPGIANACDLASIIPSYEQHPVTNKPVAVGGTATTIYCDGIAVSVVPSGVSDGNVVIMKYGYGNWAITGQAFASQTPDWKTKEYKFNLRTSISIDLQHYCRFFSFYADGEELIGERDYSQQTEKLRVTFHTTFPERLLNSSALTAVGMYDSCGNRTETAPNEVKVAMRNMNRLLRIVEATYYR